MGKDLLVLLSFFLLLCTPINGQLLTDPGPLCAGETVTLTCDISGSVGPNLLIWEYDGVQVISIAPGATTLPATRVVSGVEFTVLDTQMDTVSQISFLASVMMSGRTLGCGGNGQTGAVTFHVDPVVGPPSNVRLSDSIPPIHGIGQSNVTIEWTPPPNGGNDVMYTIGTTPAPLSGAMSVTTSSTQTTITVRYNTIYTVTVGVNTTCAGVQEATGTIRIAGCPRLLPPMDGSITPFPATNEGAEIVYHCDPGFQPQSNVTAMCASNGLWTPDPAQHQCIADCGAPAIPSNVSVLGDVSSTTENATVTFQCVEGLIPSDPIITCTRNGQWSPDPAGVQCVPNITEDPQPSGFLWAFIAVLVVWILTVILLIIIVTLIKIKAKPTRTQGLGNEQELNDTKS